MKRPSKRRRLIIQLAALVDLLFVVMFLQYTEQMQAGARLQSAAANADAVKNQALENQDNLLKSRNDLQSEVEELKKKLAKETYKNVDIEKQLRQIGEMAREQIAGVDPNAITKTLSGAPPDEVAAILAAFTETKGKNAAQVIQMLRKSSELKNWCDIWEVHLFDDDHVRLRAPKVGDREFTPKDSNDFSVHFIESVKGAGEPKGLVIIMFTHGNAHERAISKVEHGLEDVQKIWSGQQPGKRIQVTAKKYSAEAP
jgi:hypothetical protein